MNKKNVLVTGSAGFIGKNLCARLQEMENISLLKYDIDSDEEELYAYLNNAEIIYHLAGSNRPKDDAEFTTINFGLTEKIINYLINHKKKTKIVFASSTQAQLNNPYGESKRKAEDSLLKFAEMHFFDLKIYRLTNVFGKWCRPNYNSVVATFCHNIANDFPITINDPNALLKLIYIDDLVNEFALNIDSFRKDENQKYYYINPVFNITLESLAEKLYFFKGMRKSLFIPDVSDLFSKYLYTTYLSYLPSDKFSYSLKSYRDDRGSLTELLKSDKTGQIFVSNSNVGITRGNHYHHTKVEKFIVLKGKAEISFRKIDGMEVLKYTVSGDNIEVVDIPPGYTHNIQNVGQEEMIVLFWSSEIFNPDKADTYPLQV